MDSEIHASARQISICLISTTPIDISNLLNDKWSTAEGHNCKKNLDNSDVHQGHNESSKLIYDAIQNLRTGSRRDMGLPPFNSAPLDLLNIRRSRS